MAAIEAKVKSINRADKTIELEDGRKVPLPADLDFEFFGSQAAKNKKQGMAQAVGDLQSGMGSLGAEGVGSFLSGAGEGNPFVKLATQAFDYVPESIASLTPGEGQEDMGYFARLGENVGAIRAGRREGKQKIQQENPKSFLGGEIAGLGTGLVTPLPKFAQGPVMQSVLMGAGMSDKNIFQDPMGVAKDTAIDAAIGKGIGMVGGKLEKIAGERGALRRHPELLRAHQEATTQAEKKFLADMARQLDAVDTHIVSGISKGAIRSKEFVDNTIGMSHLAGTPEGNALSKFFLAMEGAAPESMRANDLKKMFTAIEGRIATAGAEEVPILNAFREHLAQTLPVGAAANGVKEKFGTKIFNSFEKAVDKSLGKILSDKKVISDIEKIAGPGSTKNLAKELKEYIKAGYEKMTPMEFMEDLKSGDLTQKMMGFFESNPTLQKIEQRVEAALNHAQNVAPLAQARGSEIANLMKAKAELQAMKTNLASRIHKDIASNSANAYIFENEMLQKVSNKLSSAVGVQNPFSNRAPTNMRPIGTPPPQAPQVGKVANFLEQPDFYSSNLKNLLNMKGRSGIAKMGYLFKGLPHAKLAATAGVGAAGLTSALRGVTSPTALGAFAREGIQKGGIRFVVESIADKYPSYQNGVLTDPQDRRSATAEIEQDQDIGLEDKAVLQARINRGLSIENLIKD
jgi:hypothetical protein